MTFEELLRSAFEAGVNFGQSMTGGTIDELYSDNGQDYFNWFAEHYDEITDITNKLNKYSDIL